MWARADPARVDVRIIVESAKGKRVIDSGWHELLIDLSQVSGRVAGVTKSGLAFGVPTEEVC